MLNRLASVVACLTLLVVALAPTAGAVPVTCEVRDPQTGICLIGVEAPPQVDPVSNPGPVVTGRAAGPAPTCENARGDEIPCTLGDLGSWSSARGCYVSPADPQRPGTTRSGPGTLMARFTSATCLPGTFQAPASG